MGGGTTNNTLHPLHNNGPLSIHPDGGSSLGHHHHHHPLSSSSSSTMMHVNHAPMGYHEFSGSLGGVSFSGGGGGGVPPLPPYHLLPTDSISPTPSPAGTAMGAGGGSFSYPYSQPYPSQVHPWTMQLQQVAATMVKHGNANAPLGREKILLTDTLC